ncbi:hypothetical protein DPMN_169238 [Dreissena polymorpha]|uniref:Uncharacterized protein n=1 Tax=Dreissena polymorpha TaxID=45954 RepID=A0A9D4J0D2_DREPO|nr:hypothetical protein DPMN_169238 [Dreissena polymorpha]
MAAMFFLSPIWTTFKLVGNINKNTILKRLHDDLANLVTSRVFTRKTCAHWRPSSRVTSTVFTTFELGQGIIGTNCLTKFHDDRTRNVTFRVFARRNLVDGRTTDKR